MSPPHSPSLQTRRGFDLLPWESGNCAGLAGGSLVHLSFIIFGYLGTGGGAEIALDLEHLLTVFRDTKHQTDQNLLISVISAFMRFYLRHFNF